MRRSALLFLLFTAACNSNDRNIIRGTVEMDQVDIAPQQPARVLQMLVNEGDAVTAGDTIAKEHRTERQSGETHAGVCEERAPADPRTAGATMRKAHGISGW